MARAEQFLLAAAADLAAVVNDIAQCRAALAATPGLRLLLLSPRDGADRLGVGFFKALADLVRAEHPDRAVAFAVDCADAAGQVLAALRIGHQAVLFDGAPDTQRRLAEIARQAGAVLIARPRAALDLTAAPDPESACRAYLLRQPARLPSGGPLA